MEMQLRQEQKSLTRPTNHMEQLTIMCLSNAESSDSQFTQVGDYKPQIGYGCYHNCQKPASD